MPSVLHFFAEWLTPFLREVSMEASAKAVALKALALLPILVMGLALVLPAQTLAVL
jgi:hypothetical protein